MKKFMILMLSLAVLFSFAACDNSNDTPVDPENPSTTTELNATQIQLAANEIYSLLTGSDGIIAKFPASEVTLTGDYAAPSKTSYTYTWKDEATAALEGDTEVTLTLNAKENTGATASSTTVVFENYVMDFTTSILDMYSGNYVTIAGTVGGPLVGTATVGLDNGSAKTIEADAWDTTNGSVILPSTATVTYSGIAIDSEDLLACISKPVSVGTSTAPVAVAGYETEKDYIDNVSEDVITDIEAFIALLFKDDATTAMKTSVASYVSQKLAETTYVVGGNSAATASITYEVAATNETAEIVKDSTSSIRLAPGSTFTLDLESAAPVAANANTFAATKFTLTGDFIISGATYDFTKVSIDGLEGTIAANVEGNADGASKLTITKFETTGFKGDVVATDVKTAAGPAIEQNESNDWVRTPLTEVTKEYK